MVILKWSKHNYEYLIHGFMCAKKTSIFYINLLQPMQFLCPNIETCNKYHKL